MKTFKKFGLACIALTVTTLASCSKDEDGITIPSESEIEQTTGERLHYVNGYVFTYNSEGVCTGFKQAQYYEQLTIDWVKGELSLSDTDNPMDHGLKFKTNSKGYITEISQSWDHREDGDSYKGSGVCSFSYDKSGHLTNISITSSESGVDDGERYSYKSNAKYSITWQNGNLVHVKYVEDETEDGETERDTRTYEISYDDQENKFRQWTQGILDKVLNNYYLTLANVGLFGVGTSNFPSLIVRSSDGYTGNYPITVYVNKNGLIYSELVDGRTVDYIYEDTDVHSATDSGNLPPTKSKSLFPRHSRHSAE